MAEHVYTDLHFFCGIGGTKLGTAKARAIAGGETARFQAIGGIDVDPQACRDYERLTGAPALCVDVHQLEPAALRRFAGDRRPDFVASSSPCTGFSRLLSEARSREPHYQSLNELFTRSLFLCVSTWDEPPPLMFWENVPGIMHRGAKLVADAIAMLQAHGYAVDVGNHDCGEIGGLAQRRPRWFMVARHLSRMSHVVYLPRKKRVRACSEVIGPLPMPGDTDAGGAMHSLPQLSWKNWKRLAAIPAGGDWRDLDGTVPDGKTRREVHRRHPVQAFDQPTPAITGPGGHAVEAVADPRFKGSMVADPRPFQNRMPLVPWNEPSGSVIGALQIGSGALSVADARAPGWARSRDHVGGWNGPADAVTGNGRVKGNGASTIADPRFAEGKKKNWQQVAGVTPWDREAPTVTSGAKIHSGAFQVADPRILAFTCSPRAGAYRVLRWDQAAGTVTASLEIDNGPAAIADPRVPGFRWATAEEIAAAEARPDKAPPFIPIIIAPDGTWHRPLTTYELGALQSLPLVGPDGKPVVLDGMSHTRWRKAIGNMVPPDSAEAAGEQFLLALLRSDLGMFALSAEPIWVAPPQEAA